MFFRFVVLLFTFSAVSLSAGNAEAQNLASSDRFPLLSNLDAPLHGSYFHFLTDEINAKPASKTDDAGRPTRSYTPVAALKLATNVTVSAAGSGLPANEGSLWLITPREIELSAGTYGDPSRFLQTMAGVVSGNDQRNDFIVRGGNPDENSFVIDNIEIPSINQLALSDTTGGFVSMLDADAIQQIELHADAYDSKFEQRLSSVVTVSTRPTEQVQHHSTFEVGIAGAGGSYTAPLPGQGSLFVSARQGILQYFTKDIGLNGVPKYRNFLVRADGHTSPSDSWWGLSLTGIDSIDIRPSSTDSQETNPYDTNYRGWRSTTGLNWQHLFSAHAFGVASVAHSDQSQIINQNGQFQNNAIISAENSKDSITTAKYDYTLLLNKRLSLNAGVRAAVDELHYAVAQPLGLQNPYDADPKPANAGGFARGFSTFSGSVYGQASIDLPHQARLVLGERAMDWALVGHQAFSNKVLFSIPIHHHPVHLGYSGYAQLPPTLYLLSFDNIHNLKPIHSRQFTAGVILSETRTVRLSLDAYQKHYSDYPVAAAYPQLSLATIADTFGQAFLLFPMVAQGKGLAEGIELTASLRPTNALRLGVTGAYARSWYSGLDGVLRKSNFDLPVTINMTGVWELKKGFNLSWRNSYASGKPYTPDNLALSYAQDRDVYDLGGVNSARSRFYNRLDIRIERKHTYGRGLLTWHLGVENALNRSNFYSEIWQPRTNAGTTEQDQLPLFPDGGVRYSF